MYEYEKSERTHACACCTPHLSTRLCACTCAYMYEIHENMLPPVHTPFLLSACTYRSICDLSRLCWHGHDSVSSIATTRQTSARSQIYPHTSFTEEVDFLQTMFAGSACVHGPLNSDHWCTFVADDCKRPTTAAADRTLNLMMYDLERGAAENFYKSEKVGSVRFSSVQFGSLTGVR